MTALILALFLAGPPQDTCLEWARSSYRTCVWLGQQTNHAEQATRRCKKELAQRLAVCRRSTPAR